MATINLDPLVASAIQAQTAMEKIDSQLDKGIYLAMLAQMQVMNLELEKNFGELATTIPGSPRNSFANQAAVLAGISNSLMQLNDNSVKITNSISELSSTLKIINVTMNNMATLQGIAVADQVSNNNFNQRETVAALQRNDIEPAPIPEFREIVEKQIQDSTIMKATTAFSNAVSSISNNIIDSAINYISQTEIVTWGKKQIEDLMIKLKLTKVANIAANPSQAASITAKNTANVQATSGLWKPGIQPPETFT
jgi:hypothetical protein